MKRAVVVTLAGLALAAAALGAQPARFIVEEDQVLLTYQAALGRQQLSGVSRQLHGAVEELPGGGLRVSASAPVASFQSGSAALDAMLRAALGADRFPTVEFEGRAPLGKRAGQFTVELEGTLSLHGVSRPVRVPVRVVRDGKLLFVKAAFPVDLAGFGLAPPAIAGMRLSPRLQIELHALLHAAPLSASL